MAFEVRLQQFSGPLQLLLEFIEKEDLPITEISLAEVTENYLLYLDANEVPPVELADFLVVATKLLLIKSKAILPPVPGEAEEDGSHLALQLKMYKEFVEISLKVEELYGNTDKMFCRERISPPAQQSFLPPPNVTTFVLQTAMQGLLRRLEPFFALQKASIERVVSVQQRIKEIKDAILQRSSMSFREVVKGAKSKVDVVVSFLALLELVKQKTVRTVQENPFHDINITSA